MRKADFARQHGVTRQAVSKGVAEGRVIADENGGIDPDATAAHVGTLADARRREALARAELAEMKAAQLRGTLIDRDATFAVVRGLARAERDALLLLPSRDAPAMAARLGVNEHVLRLELEDMLRQHLERPLPRFPGDDAV